MPSLSLPRPFFFISLSSVCSDWNNRTLRLFTNAQCEIWPFPSGLPSLWGEGGGCKLAAGCSWCREKKGSMSLEPDCPEAQGILHPAHKKPFGEVSERPTLSSQVKVMGKDPPLNPDPRLSRDFVALWNYITLYSWLSHTSTFCTWVRQRGSDKKCQWRATIWGMKMGQN